MSKGITSSIVAMYGSIPIPLPMKPSLPALTHPSSNSDTRWECTMEISEFAVQVFKSLPTVFL